LHHLPQTRSGTSNPALVPLVIRWGPDTSSDMLRRCAWCDEVQDWASGPDNMALLLDVWRRLHERD
jgi:hypothetical protein